MKAPPLPIAPGTELRINERLHVVKTVSDTGAVTLQCPVRRTEISYSLSELVTLRMAGDLEPVHGVSVTYEASKTRIDSKLSKDACQRISRRISYAQVCAREYPVGPKSPRLRRLIDHVAARDEDPSPPSAHSVYRWVKRYVTSGYDTAVFMQDEAVSRQRRPRKLTAPIRSSLERNIQTLLGRYVGGTLNGVLNMALAKTAKQNGYSQFVTKEGATELVDYFLEKEAERLEKKYPGPKQSDAEEAK